MNEHRDAFQDEERVGARLGAWVRELDPPPATPREEIWSGIEAARARSVPPARRGNGSASRWLKWGAPLAAMLVLGIGLGRMWAPGGAPADSAAPVSEAPAPLNPGAGAELPYRLMAVQHLTAAEALLIGLPEDARAGRTDDVAEWAGELLVGTRLLMDSPAAEDPQLAALLRDLELVLAQIASLPAAGREDQELDLIEDGIRHNDVLLRVRAATSLPAAGI